VSFYPFPFSHSAQTLSVQVLSRNRTYGFDEEKDVVTRAAPTTRALATLDPYIGELPLQRVHHDTLQTFVRARLKARISPGTINRDLAVVRRALNLSARLWRDASDRTWLETPPLIQMQRHPNKRQPYPLSIDEERLLFCELEGHLARMALFKVLNRIVGEHSASGSVQTT
jgi:hypothetical protein